MKMICIEVERNNVDTLHMEYKEDDTEISIFVESNNQSIYICKEKFNEFMDAIRIIGEAISREENKKFQRQMHGEVRCVPCVGVK